MPRLTPREVEALQCALDLAYQGCATADRVNRQYGTVRPFSRIHAAERGRIHQLWRLFVAHGLPIPPNPWTGGVNSPASLADACGQALEQEQARLKRYGQLPVCTDQQELRQVFRAQAEASELRHGPAYGRCGCPDGPSRPPSAPPRRCVARSHQDWLRTE